MDDRFDKEEYSNTRYPRRERAAVDGNTRYPRREDRKTISFGNEPKHTTEREVVSEKASEWDRFLNETHPEARNDDRFAEETHTSTREERPMRESRSQ